MEGRFLGVGVGVGVVGWVGRVGFFVGSFGDCVLCVNFCSEFCFGEGG